MPIRKTSLAWLPWSLVIFRALMGAILLADAWDGEASAWFVAGLSAGMLSDIADGMIARRIGAASESLRRTDSFFDVVFLLLVAVSAWRLFPEALESYSNGFLIAFGLLFFGQALALLKYRRLTSYHLYSSKLAGLMLFFAGAQLFLVGQTSWLMTAAVGLMILSQLESLAITLLLPDWRADVNGLWKVLSENPVRYR